MNANTQNTEIATTPEPQPNLDDLLPGCQSTTWRDKMKFCQLEGRTYAEEGVHISENPYIRDSWPWRWFNEAYMNHIDCVAT